MTDKTREPEVIVALRKDATLNGFAKEVLAAYDEIVAERDELRVEAAEAWDDAWHIASVDDIGFGPSPIDRTWVQFHALSRAVRDLRAAKEGR